MPTDLLQMWLGTMGILAIWAGVSRANNKPTQVVSMAVAFVFWVGFTLGAEQVTVGDAGITMRFPMLAFVGLVFAAMSLVLIGMAALGLLETSKASDEVDLAA